MIRESITEWNVNRQLDAAKARDTKLKRIKETLRDKETDSKKKIVLISQIIDLYRETYPSILLKSILGLVLLLVALVAVTWAEFGYGSTPDRLSLGNVIIYIIAAIGAGLTSTSLTGRISIRTPLLKASGPIAITCFVLYLGLEPDLSQEEQPPLLNEDHGSSLYQELFEVPSAWAQSKPPVTGSARFQTEYNVSIFHPINIEALRTVSFTIYQSMVATKGNAIKVFSLGSVLKSLINALDDGQDFKIYIRCSSLLKGNNGNIERLKEHIESQKLTPREVTITYDPKATATIEIYVWPTGEKRPW